MFKLHVLGVSFGGFELLALSQWDINTYAKKIC